MLILEIAAGIVLGAILLALIPVVLELLAEGWSWFWEFVDDAFGLVWKILVIALVLLCVTTPMAIWRVVRFLAMLVKARHRARYRDDGTCSPQSTPPASRSNVR